MPSEIAHQGGVVRGHLGGRADVPTRFVEVELSQPEAAKIPDHLQGDAESFRL